MQTFLPYPDFRRSAAVLDMRRLGKQRVEARQILNTLQGLSLGWVNHPAVKMWRGHEKALAEYGEVICKEWISRGYKDTLLGSFHMDGSDVITYPSWFGQEEFHLAHRSKLLYKDPDWYYPFFGELPVLEYVWPV
ncbi:MAG: cytoplasmic protein [Hyphomicrobiaceae bacterium]|nr:MAG: cytoplasmic protein [Hyphomicrobiaceae bacterium]